MSRPIYKSPFMSFNKDSFDNWCTGWPWLEVTTARKELFMTVGGGLSYTYGAGRGIRTYTSIDMDQFTRDMMDSVNRELGELGPMNGCFLNMYENEKNALGWHSDDFENMDQSKAVAVLSFGEEREIWWRKIGEKGEVPLEQRQLLENGSLFIMLPGFQYTHEHRIPKGSKPMDRRVSLTFRAFKGI